jgi:dephospho-CoA kinase
MIIGITGSIASGKSIITSYLKSKEFYIIDCDCISHDVLKLPKVIERIALEFGNEVIVDNQVDRKALGKIIYNDSCKNELLKSIVFPEILKTIKEEISRHTGIIFLDAPLLFEYNIEYLVDKIIVVKSDKDIQVQRLMARDNISKEYAIKKIESQLAIEIKENKADYVVVNNDSIENVYKQIDLILQKLED